MGNGNTWWRALIAITVVIALPMLAMPKVSNAINDWLYGDSKKVVPPLPELKRQADIAPSAAQFDDDTSGIAKIVYEEDSDDFQSDGKVQRLGFEEPPEDKEISKARSNPNFDQPNRGKSSAPPLLDPPATNSILPVSTPEDSLSQVRLIRDELANWGAEYILLESLDDGKKFRFCCLMADKHDQQVTFPFEATAPDAAVAAESVRTAVQAWRRQQEVAR